MSDIKKQITEYIPRLRRYARVLLRNHDDADDLVQDCLERACSRVSASLPILNMQAWLFTIMHNVFVNNIRAKMRRPKMTEYDEDLSLSAAGTPEDSIVVRDITTAMELLPVEQREVLLLVAVENMRYEDIAELLNVPIGTVMSRLSRARKQLWAIMEQGKVATLKRVK